MELAKTTCCFKTMNVCNILHTWEVAGMCQGMHMQSHKNNGIYADLNLRSKDTTLPPVTPCISTNLFRDSNLKENIGLSTKW